MDKDKRLMEASWWEKLTEGKLGLVLMGGAMLSKSLILFSIDGWGCVPSLLFDLRPNYGGGHEGKGCLLQKGSKVKIAISFYLSQPCQQESTSKEQEQNEKLNVIWAFR